jgi:hypothetical protein
VDFSRPPASTATARIILQRLRQHHADERRCFHRSTPLRWRFRLHPLDIAGGSEQESRQEEPMAFIRWTRSQEAVESGLTKPTTAAPKRTRRGSRLRGFWQVSASPHASSHKTQQVNAAATLYASGLLQDE